MSDPDLYNTCNGRRRVFHCVANFSLNSLYPLQEYKNYHFLSFKLIYFRPGLHFVCKGICDLTNLLVFNKAKRRRTMSYKFFNPVCKLRFQVVKKAHIASTKLTYIGQVLLLSVFGKNKSKSM